VPDFVHGRLTKVFLNGVDVSRILTNAGVTGGYDTAETTTFGQGYQSFITSLRSGGEVTLDGRVEDVQTHILRRALRDAEGLDNSLLNISYGNDSNGQVGGGLRGLVTTKEFTAASDDVVQVSVGFAGNRGLDDCLVLHPSTTVETTTSAGTTGVDDDAPSPANTQAVGYLHVLDMTGGATPTLTAKIQDSPDNTTWTDLVVFSAATAARTAQRVVVNDPPARWFRCAWTLTGTPTSCKFSIMVARGRANEDLT
jgi:hypothetical protein